MRRGLGRREAFPPFRLCQDVADFQAPEPRDQRVGRPSADPAAHPPPASPRPRTTKQSSPSSQARRSSPTFVAKVLPLQTAQRQTRAPPAELNDDALRLTPLHLSGGNQPGDGLSSARDDHFLPLRDLVKQRRKVGLRRKRADTQSVFSRSTQPVHSTSLHRTWSHPRHNAAALTSCWGRRRSNRARPQETARPMNVIFVLLYRRLSHFVVDYRAYTTLSAGCRQANPPQARRRPA